MIRKISPLIVTSCT